MSVRIITDSASDMSPAEHPALNVLPLSVTFGTDVYMDGIDIDHQRFYEMLVERDELPKTGQVNPYAFSQAIAEVREAGDEAVIITVGAKLSGTNQSARTALAEAPGGDVFVVDSNNVTLGERVLVEYENGKVKRLEAVVVSTQHGESVTTEQLRKDIEKLVIRAVLPENLMDGNTKIYINPTGRFEIGGPHGDSGLTGRKIIVDTYGGSCAHGGGAFSGKDPTKVDRSAAYFARYICKNIVAAGLADECTLEVAYAIGVARPVSLFVNTKGTGKLPDEKIADIIAKEFDMRPYSIIKTLDLRRPIYEATAAYGHFGRPEFPWERLDRVNDLKKYL